MHYVALGENRLIEIEIGLENFLTKSIYLNYLNFCTN